MPSSAAYDSTGVEYFELPDFHFENGTVLSPAKLAYRSFNSSAAKKALIPTCYGGHINTTLNFTKGALSDYHVIVVALFGNGESSAPSNDPSFPSSLDYRDCVKAQYKLVTEKFDFKSLDAVVGFSMGGQTTYTWAAMYPEFVKNAVPICSSARTSLHNYQFLEGPKAALMNSIDYEDGKYKEKGIIPYRGLHAFGRAYSAWLFSPEWFEERYFETKLGFKTLEEYTVNGAEKGYDNWDAEDLLVMAGMWQKGDITVFNPDHSNSLETALGNIKARVLVMPGRTDQYFRPDASEKEVRSLKKGELAVIDSVWGHTAGGGANEADTKWVDQTIARFLQSGSA